MVEEKLLLRHNFEYKGSRKSSKEILKKLLKNFHFHFLVLLNVIKLSSAEYNIYPYTVHIDEMRKESASGC